MTFATTRCSTVGQQEIAFDVDTQAASLSSWLLEYFETQALSGIRFEAGQTIALGWSLLLLREGKGRLEVYEPDFDAMPIRWCRGVNNTLRHLTLQQSICELFGCEPSFPSIRHAGVVSPAFLDSRDYTMSRDCPSGSDSGWVFAENGYTGSEGDLVSLYQLALQKVAIVPYLALPETAFVRVKPGLVEVTVEGKLKSSEDCELLRKLAAEPILV